MICRQLKDGPKADRVMVRGLARPFKAMVESEPEFASLVSRGSGIMCLGIFCLNADLLVVTGRRDWRFHSLEDLEAARATEPPKVPPVAWHLCIDIINSSSIDGEVFFGIVNDQGVLQQIMSCVARDGVLKHTLSYCAPRQIF